MWAYSLVLSPVGPHETEKFDPGTISSAAYQIDVTGR